MILSTGGVSATGGCLVQGGVCSRGVPGPKGGSAPRGDAWSWGVCLVETIPPRTATAAGGMHPTGMHSCCSDLLKFCTM